MRINRSTNSSLSCQNNTFLDFFNSNYIVDILEYQSTTTSDSMNPGLVIEKEYHIILETNRPYSSPRDDIVNYNKIETIFASEIVTDLRCLSSNSPENRICFASAVVELYTKCYSEHLTVHPPPNNDLPTLSSHSANAFADQGYIYISPGDDFYIPHETTRSKAAEIECDIPRPEYIVTSDWKQMTPLEREYHTRNKNAPSKE